MRPAESSSRSSTRLVNADLHRLVLDLHLVQARAAAPDQTARLAVARGEAGAPEQLDHTQPAHEAPARGTSRRSRRLEGHRIEARAEVPLEDSARRLGRSLGGRLAPAEPRRLVGQDLLGLVELGALEGLEPLDLVERQVGEQPQEAADVGVVGVAPVLVVVVRRRGGRR